MKAARLIGKERTLMLAFSGHLTSRCTCISVTNLCLRTYEMVIQLNLFLYALLGRLVIASFSISYTPLCFFFDKIYFHITHKLLILIHLDSFFFDSFLVFCKELNSFNFLSTGSYGCI